MSIVFSFDVRTIAFFVALTFFVQGAVIGAQAFLIRDLRQYQGVGTALIANLCAAVGLMLRLFMDRLPDFFTTILSNILLLAGSGLFYIALSRFTEQAYSKSLVTAVIGVVLSLLVYFTYWDDDLGLRMISFSLGSLAMVSILIAQLWHTQKTSLRFSATLMLVSFIVHGLFLIIRTVSLILNPPHDSASLTPVQSATYLLSFAVSFFWSTGFILMVSQRLRNDLMEMVTIDVLTRIPNRRATQAFLEKELSRAQRNQGEFSILLIDIDNFKQVNDQWGHAVGDHVLVKTSAIFQARLRKYDWVGRWGGEEFLIILPGPCDAGYLAERVRSEIAGSEYNHGDASVDITVSIGVVCVKPPAEIDQILKSADDALYRSKLTRNTVTVSVSKTVMEG